MLLGCRFLESPDFSAMASAMLGFLRVRMTSRHWLLVFAATCALLGGTTACVSESGGTDNGDSLNPQPLPPHDPDRSPGATGSVTGGGDESNDAPTPAPMDPAGASADAGAPPDGGVGNQLRLRWHLKGD
jgi:hypothetical protein